MTCSNFNFNTTAALALLWVGAIGSATAQQPSPMARYCGRAAASLPKACAKQEVKTFGTFRFGPEGTSELVDFPVKFDARLNELRPELADALPRIRATAKACGVAILKVTSGDEPWGAEVHVPGSAHVMPGGGALDLETKNTPRAAVTCWEKALKSEFSADQFHIEWERPGRVGEHLHFGLSRKARKPVFASLN